MNSSALLLSLAIFVSGAIAMAETRSVDLRCTGNSLEECNAKSLAALSKMGCAPKSESVLCAYHEEVDGDGTPTGKQVAYCGVESERCIESKPYLFGGVYCESGFRKISLSKFDRNLSLGFSMGVGPYVTTICKSIATP